jgi:type II secretory pathway pseudopilin PulG
MHKRQRRRAFTLSQLLVLLAILAILFGLGLPALLKARAAAARAMRLNNLRQLGLATLNYADTNNGILPAGNDKNHFSATARLLPYLEQDNVYKMIDFDKPITDKANAPARGAKIKVLLSPSDPVQSVNEEFGATNYLFNAGTKHSLDDNDGVFYQDSKLNFPAAITDGTSNTIFIGETLKGDGGKKAVDVHRQYVLLDKKALKDLDDDSGVEDFKKDKHIAGDRCASWMDGRFLQGTFNGARQPNDMRPDVSCDGAGGLSALRSLDEMVNVEMGDGSARSIKMTIAVDVWKALLTRAGGEVVPADF